MKYLILFFISSLAFADYPTPLKFHLGDDVYFIDDFYGKCTTSLNRRPTWDYMHSKWFFTLKDIYCVRTTKCCKYDTTIDSWDDFPENDLKKMKK